MDTHPAFEPNTFPWHDEGVVRRTPPLALAARMACLLESLQADAVETTNDSEAGIWIGCGIANVVTALEQAGELGTISTLLTGLEGLVAPTYRARWPLARQIAAEHPVVAPLEEAATS